MPDSESSRRQRKIALVTVRLLVGKAGLKTVPQAQRVKRHRLRSDIPLSVESNVEQYLK
jgi:hypothetical protein